MSIVLVGIGLVMDEHIKAEDEKVLPIAQANLSPKLYFAYPQLDSSDFLIMENSPISVTSTLSFDEY